MNTGTEHVYSIFKHYKYFCKIGWFKIKIIKHWIFLAINATKIYFYYIKLLNFLFKNEVYQISTYSNQANEKRISDVYTMFFHVQIPISSIKSERKNLFPMLWPAFINRIFKYRWNSCNIPCCFIEAREINVTQANRYKKKKKEKNIYTVSSLWCGNKIPLRHVVWFIRIRCTTIKRKKRNEKKRSGRNKSD